MLNMKNLPNIPEELLAYLEQKSFEQLSESERSLVLKYFSETEYNDCHLACQQSQLYYNQDIQPSSKVKMNLKKVFSEKHSKSSSLLQYRIELWKIAAALIPIVFVGYLTLNHHFSSKQFQTLIVHDTIVLQQKVNIAQRIIDTLIQPKTTAQTKLRSSSKDKVVALIERDEDTSVFRLQQELNIGLGKLQPEELNENLRPKNGKSMEQDELLKQFSFAKI